MANRYIELFLQSDPPAAGPVHPSRNPPAQNVPSFHDDDIDTDALFSRRGGSGSSSITNSAYEGFYGTATHRSIPTGGASKFSASSGTGPQRQYF